jgi:2Fe-2S ferredoxin
MPLALAAATGETVMAAAERLGFAWPTVCGGNAECGVCALEVVAGGAALAPATVEEAARLAALPERRLYPDRTYRLACRVVGVDGLVVRKRGVVARRG